MFSITTRAGLVIRKTSGGKRKFDEGTKGMATLKAISNQLKSVKNIKKITQSMKMVSAAKFTRAERELRQAKPLGDGARVFYKYLEEEEEKPPDPKKKVLYVAMTSDRGLCGAVHTSIVKSIRNELNPDEAGENVKIVCVGDKSRTLLQRVFGGHILFACNEIGRLPPTFMDASILASAILNSEFEFELVKVFFNRFRTVVSYATEQITMPNLDAVSESPKLTIFDELDEETLLSFLEFTMVATVYSAMKESACSEQSSRMTAMDNASKNAGDMIGKLTLSFNRTRQAVITRELIEIISGASAL